MEACEIAPGIVVDPAIRFGKPTIRGTRVPVDLIIAKLSGGMNNQEVAEEYGLTVNEVLAALAYAARVLASEDMMITA
jgi:uncharacterized protein (DUF433 family)